MKADAKAIRFPWSLPRLKEWRRSGLELNSDLLAAPQSRLRQRATYAYAAGNTTGTLLFFGWADISSVQCVSALHTNGYESGDRAVTIPMVKADGVTVII